RGRGDLATATALEVVARAPQSVWLGDWTPDPAPVVARATAAAARAGTVPVFVLYAVPHRDCGGDSAGGMRPASYRAWVRSVARALGSRRSVVVVEPDALTVLDCLSAAGQVERLALLRDALQVLRGTSAVTYVDAGHADWVSPDVVAQRLRTVGVSGVRGVAVNVSGFQTTAASTRYAAALAARLPGLHAVVDTSRNGRGPTADATWCNPAGRALGTTSRPVADPVVDALLWVKRPGESDGACGRDEPSAGSFWAGYAVGLVQRSR
ncbi:MAG: 1,4-beta cellobiohydrolase, partial [Frankiales bacterium]|nr:1,4-beta cellobiohydrolase [Frankiales bacterium]